MKLGLNESARGRTETTKISFLVAIAGYRMTDYKHKKHIREKLEISNIDTVRTINVNDYNIW
jgi:hypothetical protein